MKKVTFLLAVGLMCLAACAQKKGGERGPRQGGHMVINKDSDSVFVALKQEALGKFKQLTFNDEQTGKTMEYNLLVPEGAEAGKKLPLVLFMADASTAGKEVTAPLTQGYGALEFASDRDQQKHPSFVLVPQYTDWAVQDDWSTTQTVCKEYNVDTNRLYTTGQSMGGMMSFYFNITHPDLFAASLFVSSQWDTSKMQDFGNKHFFYIVAGGDQKAYGGMQDLAKVLKANDARVDSASWSAKLPATGRGADSPWRQHQLHQVGNRQRTPGNGTRHGAHGIVRLRLQDCRRQGLAVQAEQVIGRNYESSENEHENSLHANTDSDMLLSNTHGSNADTGAVRFGVGFCQR